MFVDTTLFLNLDPEKKLTGTSMHYWRLISFGFKLIKMLTQDQDPNFFVQYWYHIVVFTKKRSQAKVFTVYLSLAGGYSYLECNNYT